MTPLLAVLAAGPLLGGYRHPAAWSVAAGALWLASVPASPAIPPAAPAWILWLVWTILAAAASPEPLVSFGAVGESMTAVLALALACGASEDARRKWVRGLLFAGPLLAAAALALPDLGQGRYVGLLPPYYNYTACLEAA
ncbi:MAG: hypothetical protein HY553_01685, partial [Elusimicrobia bacterium]|nr:hypothetical protein [Elusimicrobiota bacterium]